MSRSRSRKSAARRVQKHRQSLRAAGLRPIQIWVPDVRSKGFAANGLTAPCNLMIDKVMTVPKQKVGTRIGRLEDADLVRLNRAIVVFLGLAGASAEE